MQGRERRVAAEVDLDGGREPAKRPPVADPAHEGGLGDPELECDLLEILVGHRPLEQHDHRGVAPFGLADEGVDPPKTMTEAHFDRIHL